MSNPHIGSDFDDFLQEEGILEDVEAAAIKKMVACMIEQEMAATHSMKLISRLISKEPPND